MNSELVKKKVKNNNHKIKKIKVLIKINNFTKNHLKKIMILLSPPTNENFLE